MNHDMLCRMKVAIQGQAGSFHYIPAVEFFGKDVDIIACKTFKEVFEALESGQAERAIVGLENSLYGSINQSYDLLTQYRPYMIGESYVHVRFSLFTNPQFELKDVTSVFSQAPALAECRHYLAKHLPGVEQLEWNDTAASAEHVANNPDQPWGAICSYEAGQLHGLKEVASGIEDNTHNYTRFAVLSKTDISSKDADKTSIILKTSHQPGALARALTVFADAEINLSKLESRPIPGPSWQYIFYVDFEAAYDSKESISCLEQLRKQGNQVTILGSYKRGTLPNSATN